MINKSEKLQYFATICVNLASITFGSICGWPSASFLVLQSDESPLENGPMTNEESSWVASVLCIGGFTGNLFFGWLSSKIGGKLTILLLSGPFILSWIMIIISKNVLHLIISRFLGGFGGGGLLALVPLYITDISEDRIRGNLGSYLVLSANFGTLVAFILGNYISYTLIPYILLVFPIIFIGTMSILPDTPQRLLKINRVKDAEKSLRFFRNVRRLSQEVSDKFKIEMEKLKREFLYEDEKHINNDSTALTWSDFNNRIARKSMLIGIGIMALNQFCGCFAMINYTATIFKHSKSNLSPNMSSIIVGIIQLFGSYVSTMLVERAGRKLLIVTSAIGTGIGLSVLGSYVYLDVLHYDVSGFEWIPVTSFSFVIFSASCGVLTLPFLVTSEILPLKIRTVGSIICANVLWIFAFVMVKYLPIFNELFGLHGTMSIFATCSFVGAMFVLIFVPETKGKSIETILSLM